MSLQNETQTASPSTGLSLDSYAWSLVSWTDDGRRGGCLQQAQRGSEPRAILGCHLTCRVRPAGRLTPAAVPWSADQDTHTYPAAWQPRRGQGSCSAFTMCAGPPGREGAGWASEARDGFLSEAECRCEVRTAGLGVQGPQQTHVCQPAGQTVD